MTGIKKMTKPNNIKLAILLPFHKIKWVSRQKRIETTIGLSHTFTTQPIFAKTQNLVS